MTSAHFLFIPGVLMVGIIIGFVFGGRVARDQAMMEAKRDEERKKARDARQQRKKERSEDSSSGVA